MTMDVREKLVELLQSAPADIMGNIGVGVLADHLISNGVTVQECKLGDKKTNADCIRNMTDDELKNFICSLLQCEYCKFGIRGGCDLLKWLQQPAEEADNEAN